MVPDDRYRLTPVRDVRARAERVGRGDLADAVGDARTTETVLKAALSRVQAARDALAAAVQAVATEGELPRRLLAERYAARRRRDLEAALDEAARAGSAHDGKLGVVDEARHKLIRARAEREVIERHFARWRDERRKQIERRED